MFITKRESLNDTKKIELLFDASPENTIFRVFKYLRSADSALKINQTHVIDDPLKSFSICGVRFFAMNISIHSKMQNSIETNSDEILDLINFRLE